MSEESRACLNTPDHCQKKLRGLATMQCMWGEEDSLRPRVASPADRPEMRKDLANPRRRPTWTYAGSGLGQFTKLPENTAANSTFRGKSLPCPPAPQPPCTIAMSSQRHLFSKSSISAVKAHTPTGRQLCEGLAVAGTHNRWQPQHEKTNALVAQPSAPRCQHCGR